MNRHPDTLISLLALALALATIAARPAFGQEESHGPPATAVRVALVETRTLQEHRKITGELRAVSISQVATIEPGLVTALPIDEGQVVEAGDVLAVLDSRRLKIDLVRLEAQVKVADARVASRTAAYAMEKSDADSLRSLDARGASNPKELADAESKLAMADADREGAVRDLAVAQANADLLRTRLSDMSIVAPFHGVVVTTHTEVGEWLGEGDAVAEIVASGTMDAWLDVPQRFAPAVLAANGAVQIQVDATKRMYPPRQPRVVPVVDNTARTFKIYVRVDDPEEQLAPGMTVSGWVPTGKRGDYLTVPRNAIMRNDAGPFVYVGRESANGPTQAAPVAVEVLFADGDRVAVRSDRISAGDAVVVEGNERLFPMMPIRYERPAAPPRVSTPGTAGETGETDRAIVNSGGEGA